MVPDGDGRALPPEVGLEDKTFHSNKQELGEGHDVPTSWELPAGTERQNIKHWHQQKSGSSS